jgi:hypothetical protein
MRSRQIVALGLSLACALAAAACGSETSRRGFDETDLNGTGAGEGKDGTSTLGTEPTGDAGAGTSNAGKCAPDALDQTGCACATAGATRQCFAGPGGSRGVGICRDGQQTCTPKNELGGTWGPCEGGVLPAAEDCTGVSDRNCDGKIGCDDPSCSTSPKCQPACNAGDTKPCYTGPAGTLGKGICVAGVYTCENGKWGTTCTGQTLPATEVCSGGQDENCNGLVDCNDSLCAPTPACCTPNTSSVDGTIYANTSDALYRVDPVTFAVTKVGNFNAGDQMTDVAVTPAGAVYGVSFTALYSINKTTGKATFVASVGGNGNNSLTFLPSGDLQAADSNGDVKRINPATGAVTNVGNYGGNMGGSGDLVAIASGQMFATATGSNTDLLVKVAANGAATVVGQTGQSSVWGLAYAGSRVVGFTTGGQILKIDPATGQSQLLANTGVPFWGAGQSPLVIANGCP